MRQMVYFLNNVHPYIASNEKGKHLNENKF